MQVFKNVLTSKTMIRKHIFGLTVKYLSHQGSIIMGEEDSGHPPGAYGWFSQKGKSTDSYMKRDKCWGWGLGQRDKTTQKGPLNSKRAS